MPHVKVSFATRDLSTEQQQSFANDLVDVLKKHLSTTDDAISVEFEEVPSTQWKSSVYDPRIKPQLDSLVKKPGYEM
ncbi:tautomerase PptA [Shewanella avicenniae]|uniref:Tautomerase PptA n=1 Tax=Shewanella avicenniae TaxID=2814294 RepID=A0ABX7QKY9_9GAMM|nr:tautomerase PptA [Shewanella avicenniae]QSX32117.1 tautomerase PptA [Shewanella avicenniae]